MKRLAHIFVVLLVAIFAVGTVAHATATTGMSLRMAVADVDMDDCDGCDKSGGAVVTCDQTCIQSFAALPASEPAEIAFATISLRQSALHDIIGHSGPPERHPPR